MLATAQSIHQEQLEHYNSLGNATANYYEQTTTAAEVQQGHPKLGCSMEKVVYGWHPYWVGNAYQNYDWDVLTHFSFFSYEVDAATGDPITTHGWSSSTAVDAALASGNTKVTLTVTLFSDHGTFFSSPTAPQNCITNLINLVQSRGADGVNIDIEGLPSAYKTEFTNFMIDLSNQMHTAIPGSEVSTVLYAVDWNNIFDFNAMASVVDHFIIMGYGYYWSGSSNAGPSDPLYHFGSTYNYSLSKTITDYLEKGCPKQKLILGLGYYGREWETTNATFPSSATSSGVAKTYTQVKNNSSGNYSASNHQYDDDSFTDVYVYNNGNNNQCFIALENSIRKRMEHIRTTDIGGMGIWALGYDDGYTELWSAIGDYMTDCYESPCSGTIHDFGGPYKNYYDDEDYTWTIAPPGATAIQLDFTSFDVESGFDYLYVYDGATTSASQIPGSPFSGNAIPPNFTSSSGALTFRFTSDGATTAPGFVANYSCTVDNQAPTTSVSSTGNWKTTDFTVDFTDTDNSGGTGLQNQFYQVSDYDGTLWRANGNSGFFADDFSTLHTDWTSVTGIWNVNNGTLIQSDEGLNNTNISAVVDQSLSDTYLYHFTGSIEGSGSNKRAGFHFFADDHTLPNRGNSYFVWFRVDDAKVQIYKVANDNFGSPVVDLNLNTTAGQLYDFKVIYNSTSGEIKVYRDNQFITSWTDANPYTSGDYISFRSGNAVFNIEDLKVYRSRGSSTVVSIGSNNDIRYQNANPFSPSGKINSMVVDNSHNFSAVATEMVNVDWTAPNSFTVDDGVSNDIDTTQDNTSLVSHWNATTDPHSDVVAYWYAIGTTPGDSNIVNWTNNGLNTVISQNGLSLNNNQEYFYSVRAENGAGLLKEVSTDGIWVVLNTNQIKELSDIKVSTFPNPFHEQLMIEFSQQSEGILQLYDMTGKIVKSQRYNQSKITLDFSLNNLERGQYTLVLSNEKQRKTIKLIKY